MLSCYCSIGQIHSIYSPGGWIYDAHLCTAGTGNDNRPAYGYMGYTHMGTGTKSQQGVMQARQGPA